VSGRKDNFFDLSIFISLRERLNNTIHIVFESSTHQKDKSIILALKGGVFLDKYTEKGNLKSFLGLSL